MSISSRPERRKGMNASASRTQTRSASDWLAGLSGVLRTALAAVTGRGRKASSIAGQVGAYTLAEKIGEGGMGVVYRACRPGSDRPTAVKLLAPGRTGERALTRFVREAELTSRLHHPNTISVFDFGPTADGGFYYAMEYVEGEDLEKLVEREGVLSPSRVAHLLAQLAASLAEAHAAGLVHRDVKPANLMLCTGREDRLKVLDFGLIKQLEATPDVTRTDELSLIGTPLYVSPEALIDPGSVGPKSDLYALGAVGYFLLTGMTPFSGRNAVEVCAHHLHTAPLPPSKRSGRAVPRELETLILKCLEKDPTKRPTSAASLELAFRRIAATPDANCDALAA
jgi:serine/threonine-protein kinase